MRLVLCTVDEGYIFKLYKIRYARDAGATLAAEMSTVTRASRGGLGTRLVGLGRASHLELQVLPKDFGGRVEAEPSFQAQGIQYPKNRFSVAVPCFGLARMVMRVLRFRTAVTSFVGVLFV